MEDKDYSENEPIIPLDLYDDFEDDGQSPLIPIYDEEENCNGPIIPLDLEALKNYNGKICPKCGREYGEEYKYAYCRKDGGKLLLIWKCQQCGEDFSKMQGYTAINVCPNCGNMLGEHQKNAINNSKSGERNNLKRICAKPECKEVFDDDFEYCSKCGSKTIPMHCICGEIFRQKDDKNFDQYCPKCREKNPLEKIRDNQALEESRLGDKYYNEKDYAYAFEHYMLAYEKGYLSQSNENRMGYMYQYGQGVEKDYSEAVKWYKKAADQGYAGAQCNLGVMYENGYGVEKDYSEAAKWYRKAADQGYDRALRNLSELYEKGKDIPKKKKNSRKIRSKK